MAMRAPARGDGVTAACGLLRNDKRNVGGPGNVDVSPPFDGGRIRLDRVVDNVAADAFQF